MPARTTGQLGQWLAGSPAAVSMEDYLLTTAVLVVVIIVGGAVVLLIRHLFLQQADKPPAGLTIEQVERLRADGALTAEEYKRARRALAGASNKQPAKDKPALVGKDDESAEPTQNGGSAEGNQDQGSGGQE